MAEFIFDEDSLSSLGSDSNTTNYDNIDLYNNCYLDDNTAYYFERDAITENGEAPIIGSYLLRTSKAITIGYDVADSFLLQKAKTEFNAVAENAMLHMMRVTEKPSPFELLDIFFNSDMAIKMIKWINEYSPDGNMKITRDDLLTFFLLDLKMQYHNTSATHMFQKNQQKHYQMEQLSQHKEKYHYIMRALNNGRGKVHKKGTWHSPIHKNGEMISIFEDFGKICAGIGFINGTSMMALDDDLWRLRSKSANADSITQINNAKKGMGVVHHASVSVTTGLYCGGYVQYRGDTTETCVTNIQRILCKATTPSDIKLNGTIFYIDRGYGGTDGDVIDNTIKRGGNIHGTAKRTKTFPFIFGLGSKAGNQIDVQEYGAFAVYEASDSTNRNNVDVSAFRNGLGRVALMRTTVEQFGNGRIALIPSKKKYHFAADKHDLIQQFEGNVIIATHTQSSPEWFFARRFRITGKAELIFCIDYFI
jgi:hypothetical protein